MATTQQETARNMVRQLRLLDPSASAEIGTPERKIIDVVAQQIAERSIDLNQLQGALDIDSKFGSDLDNFLGLFRFGRQRGTQATSFVTFSRNTPSPHEILIPSETVVTASAQNAYEGYSTVIFQTTAFGAIPPGELSVTVPVRCVQVGTIGNIAVGSISSFGPNLISGVSDVYNEVPGIGGLDGESDDEFKVRFNNTVFRNVSGTTDQYLALAVATYGTAKANVVGPISRHLEYIQVPDVDDDDANGAVGEFTSALSVIPYSKYTYAPIPYYVTDGSSVSPYFYRRDIDYVMNVAPWDKDRGDANRQRFDEDDPGAFYRPNVTFSNVLPASTDPKVDGLRPGKVVLFEHSYMSSSSRNDYDNGILNCVDVYIDGINDEFTDNILPKPSISDAFRVDSASIRHYNNFRRKGSAVHRPVVGNVFQPLFWQPVSGLPEDIIVDNNTFYKGTHYWEVVDVTELRGTVRARNGIEWNPNIPGRSSGDAEIGPYSGDTILEVTEDSVIEITGYRYNRNIADLQVSMEADKQVTTDVLAHEFEPRYFKFDITLMYSYGYSSDSVNESVMYALRNHFRSQTFGSVTQLSDVMQAIRGASGVDNCRWSYDQLRESDGEGAIDVEGNPRMPVVECDADGQPITRAIVDRIQQGTGDKPCIDQIYLSGDPDGGQFLLSYRDFSDQVFPYDNTDAQQAPDYTVISFPLPHDITAEDIENRLRSEQGDFAGGSQQSLKVTVGGVGTGGTPENPWIITWTSDGNQPPLQVRSNLRSRSSQWRTDFALMDSELPVLPQSSIDTDTVPGVRIRARAQSTWDRV